MKITCIVILSILELHAALFYRLATPLPPPSHRNSCSGQKYYVVPNFLLSYSPFFPLPERLSIFRFPG